MKPREVDQVFDKIEHLINSAESFGEFMDMFANYKVKYYESIERKK